jgi:zinc protease
VKTHRAAAAGRRLPFAEAVRERRLENGARFFVLENHFNPTVALSGGLAGGAIFAPADRRVIASVTAEELLKGSERRTKLEIAEELEGCGASLSFSTDSSDLVGVDIGGAALSRDTERLLDTLVEVLRMPVFPEEELEKEKKRLVGAIRQAQDQTSHRAYEAAARAIYPEGHPFRRRTAEERIARVESLARGELRQFYVDRYGASTLQLVVVGDVEAGRVLDGLEDRFGDWVSGPGGAFLPVPVPPPAPVRQTVEMPDKASADVVLAQPADLVRTAPDFVACTLANSALGQSSLSSRLGVRVRDVEGLTYGIHSSFTAGKVPGPFTVTLTVKPESRDAAIASTLDEIARFRKKGMTATELAHEKSSRIGKFQVDLASNAGIADAIDASLYYAFGVSYLDEYPSRVAAVTREEANEAFKRRVNPDWFTIVSAGSFDGAAESGNRQGDGATGRRGDKETGRPVVKRSPRRPVSPSPRPRLK